MIEIKKTFQMHFNFVTELSVYKISTVVGYFNIPVKLRISSVVNGCSAGHFNNLYMDFI